MSLSRRLPRPSPPTAAEMTDALDHDEAAEQILDAARDEFLEFGLRRASIDSVADRLGIGRMTVYRRFSNKDALARAVLLRDTQRYIDGVSADTGRTTVRSSVEEGFAAGVLRNRDQRLLQSLLERDPQTAMAYVIGAAAGQLLEFATTATQAAIGKADDAAEYTTASLDAVATAMIRLAHSYSVAPPEGGLENIDAKYLRTVARAQLVPLLERRQLDPSRSRT